MEGVLYISNADKQPNLGWICTAISPLKAISPKWYESKVTGKKAVEIVNDSMKLMIV